MNPSILRSSHESASRSVRCVLLLLVFTSTFDNVAAFQPRSLHNRLRSPGFLCSRYDAVSLFAVSENIRVDSSLTDSIIQEGEQPQALQDENNVEVPTIRTILAFAIPAIGIWLCSPLLSMIDTSTVGLLCGTAQQAALNPAVAVTDYSARTMSFLFTGTTNMIALARERDQGDDTAGSIAATFAGALQLSWFVGLGLGAFLLVFASPMVRVLIGSNNAIDMEVFHAAISYVRIRALSMPAAAMIGTAQAACLGVKDVRSPLYVMLAAAFANLILDLALVGHPSSWIGGASGAAWATTISQYIAVTLFLRWLGTKGQTEGTSKLPGRLSSRLALLMSWRRPRRTTDASTTRGLLLGRLNWKTFLQKPSNETLSGFNPYVVPVTTTQVGRCSTYVAMNHVVSSSLCTMSMAAHQIITSIFYSLIPIADSLSLTAQSFLPAIAAKRPGYAKARALRMTLYRFLQVAGLCGLLLASIVACIPFASSLFTSDPTVLAMVVSSVPTLFAIFSLHGVFCGSEGVLLGQRDLTFLGRMYALFFGVVPYLLLRLKAFPAVQLSSVWNLFLGYQLVRITAWVSRVVWLQLRTEHDARSVEAVL